MRFDYIFDLTCLWPQKYLAKLQVGKITIRKHIKFFKHSCFFAQTWAQRPDITYVHSTGKPHYEHTQCPSQYPSRNKTMT